MAQLPRLDPHKRLILMTNHRRENFGPGMDQVALALANLAQRPDIEIVFPVQLNPNVQTVFRNRQENFSNLHLVDPVPYLPFIYLMDRCHLILTGFGGIQEKTPSLGKPVLVTRAVTERPEAIVSQASHLLDDQAAYQAVGAIG